MGWYGPAGGGLGYGGVPRNNTYAEAAYLLQQAQGGWNKVQCKEANKVNARSGKEHNKACKNHKPACRTQYNKEQCKEHNKAIKKHLVNTASITIR